MTFLVTSVAVVGFLLVVSLSLPCCTILSIFESRRGRAGASKRGDRGPGPHF